MALTLILHIDTVDERKRLKKTLSRFRIISLLERF